MKRALFTAVACLGLACGPFVLVANATLAFAQKEDKTCNYCHLNTTGGKDRGFRGIYYKAHAFSFKDFSEAKEAKLAGVKANSMGKDTKPTKRYPPKMKKKSG